MEVVIAVTWAAIKFLAILPFFVCGYFGACLMSEAVVLRGIDRSESRRSALVGTAFLSVFVFFNSVMHWLY